MTEMKTVAPLTKAQGHMGSAMSVVWGKSALTPKQRWDHTHNVGSSSDIDVHGEQRRQVDTTRDGIAGDVDTQLRENEGEGLGISTDSSRQVGGQASLQAKNTAARAPAPPFF